MRQISQLISIVIPCYNEEANIEPFYDSLVSALDIKGYEFEIIYVNDGSKDETLQKIQKLTNKDKRVKIVNLSRNFGKEIATSAGLHYAKGEATILIDGDGQHPPELIPILIKKWQDGADVVTGLRESNTKEGAVKRYGSKAFYRLFNKYAGVRLVPGSTDFRLLDRRVRDEFVMLTERNRITRGLVDWLGFDQDYVSFVAKERMHGQASYNLSKLLNLAVNSFVSLSLKPLYFSIYMGAVVLPISVVLIIFSSIEMLVGDPMNLRITGSAYLVMVLLFLIGIILVSQGITALYLSHIHTEAQNRPLFIIDKKNSYGIKDQKVN